MVYLVGQSLYKTRCPFLDIEEAWGDAFIEHPTYRFGFAARGIDIPDELPPKVAILETKPKVWPPFFGAGYWYCNTETRNQIERLEPGIHRFHPLTVINKRGKDLEIDLYFVEARQPVATLDIERNPLVTPKGRTELPTHSMQFFADEKMDPKYGAYAVLRRDAPSDRHLWVDPIVSLDAAILMSDDLFEIVGGKENKALNGWKMLEYEPFSAA